MTIDWQGVKTLIKWTPPNACINCNVKFRMVRKTRCEDCNFSPASAGRKSDINYFNTGFKPKVIFRQYGIPDAWGKPQLFYFFFNQHLNGAYPSGIIEDIFGNVMLPHQLDWVLHHINNNNWDDHIDNLMLCLRHEHSYFEKLDRDYYKQLFNLYEQM